MSKSSSEKSSASGANDSAAASTTNMGAPLIDPTRTSSHPGTYEDLHKKTKGYILLHLFNILFIFQVNFIS